MLVVTTRTVLYYRSVVITTIVKKL